MDNIVHLNVHYVCVMFVSVLTYWVGALQISIIIIIIKSSGCICLQEIFSGISIRKTPDGATPGIYPLVTLPVCSFSNAKCNVIGLDLLLLSFPFLQANTEYSLLCQNSLFMFHSLLSSLSLTLVSSVSPFLTHPCSSIYTSWQQRTAQFSTHVAENPCNTQSPNPLTICSSSHMQTQSPTTDH